MEEETLPDLIFNGTMMPPEFSSLETIHSVGKKIILAIALFGVVGNIINIYVLTLKRTRRWSRGTLEVVAYTGLVALAMSDMTYCAMAAVDSVFVDRIKYRHNDIQVYIQYFSKYVLNVLSYFSTWLTVLMALNRYLAICHPIYTRICFRRKLLWKIMLLIFLSWAILLLPELFESKICYSNCNSDNNMQDFNESMLDFNVSIPEFDECNCISPNGTGLAIYQIQAGPTDNTSFLTVSQVFNNIVGFIIPAMIMIYCNFHIIVRLRETRIMRRQFVCLEIGERRHSNNSIPDKPVTYSLFMVVLLFLILVTPSEVFNIAYRYSHLRDESTLTVAIVGMIANILNALNFATNFLLYCLVNVHFRRTLTTMCCGRRREVRREMSFMMCTRATSVDLL